MLCCQTLCSEHRANPNGNPNGGVSLFISLSRIHQLNLNGDIEPEFIRLRESQVSFKVALILTLGNIPCQIVHITTAKLCITNGQK